MDNSQTPTNPSSKEDSGTSPRELIITIAPITIKVLLVDILFSLEVLLETSPPVEVYQPAIELKNVIEQIIQNNDLLNDVDPTNI